MASSNAKALAATLFQRLRLEAARPGSNRRRKNLERAAAEAAALYIFERYQENQQKPSKSNEYQ